MDSSKLKQRAIFVTRHGSHAYGLSTPTSDLDIKGVLIAPEECYIGFMHTVEQVEERQPNDLVIYELTKFMKLASDCNPNIIEVLHTDDSDILYMNDLGGMLRDQRDLFLSQKAKFTFSGYAMAQMKRMKNHHEWMHNPPKPPYSREEVFLPADKNWCDAIEKVIADGGQFHLSEADKDLLETERAWRKTREQWANYQEWLKGRNPKRHELEVKFGYDTKHGMHLVRLMRMGHEILTTGKVIVKRPDREELLAIRNEGIWPYEKMIEYGETMDKELTRIYESGTSPLPRSPDRAALDKTCMDMIRWRLAEGSRWDYMHPAWDGKVC